MQNSQHHPWPWRPTIHLWSEHCGNLWLTLRLRDRRVIVDIIWGFLITLVYQSLHVSAAINMTQSIQRMSSEKASTQPRWLWLSCNGITPRTNRYRIYADPPTMIRYVVARTAWTTFWDFHTAYALVRRTAWASKKIEIDQASESYIAPIANIGVLLRILCEYDIKENIRTEEGEVSIREK